MSSLSIKVSATDGDNIIKASSRTPWYGGPPLLSYLEEIPVTNPSDEQGFSMAVQRVCRPNRIFRGFQGQVDTGAISLGDKLLVLPSGESARVAGILNAGKEEDRCISGQAVTISLDREIDISRGDVLVGENAQLLVGNCFRAQLLWMDDHRLVQGRNYLLKIASCKIPVTVLKIHYRIDVNSGDEVKADAIYKNELAVCDLSVSEKIAFDVFEKNRSLGSFILIDRVSHMTSACGVVIRKINRDDNISWYPMDITREQRAQQKGQKPFTIWFTGLSGSGKSSLANALERRLYMLGKHTMTLDGDNIRMGLNKNLGFQEADRVENIRRIAEVCKLMNDAGIIAISSFVSPYTRDRQKAREIIGSENFLEIYVSTDLEECEKRDVKGLYAKARRGLIANFTGISSPYEPPQKPDLTLDTSQLSLEEAVESIMCHMENRLGTDE